MRGETTCWMAKRPNGLLIHGTSAWTRKAAEVSLMKSFPGKVWRRLYMAGWRIVRVRAVEI